MGWEEETLPCAEIKKEKSIEIQESEVHGHYTVFENHRKSLIQHCERSELRLHFEWTKVN